MLGHIVKLNSDCGMSSKSFRNAVLLFLLLLLFVYLLIVSLNCPLLECG